MCIVNEIDKTNIDFPSNESKDKSDGDLFFGLKRDLKILVNINTMRLLYGGRKECLYKSV